MHANYKIKRLVENKRIEYMIMMKNDYIALIN